MTPTDEKPSRNEDEYFVRLDQERLREMRAKLDAERAQAERSQHLGRCPRCGAKLEERDHHHVRIDECPECGGVWLDKGELQMLEHVSQEQRGSFIGNLFGLKR